MSPVTCLAYFLGYVSQDCVYFKASIGLMEEDIKKDFKAMAKHTYNQTRLNPPRGRFSENHICMQVYI